MKSKVIHALEVNSPPSAAITIITIIITVATINSSKLHHWGQ